MNACHKTNCPPGSCPACGRYIGPAFTCPYCDVEQNRTALRLLRWTAFLFTSAGLTILLVLAHREPSPVTPITGITASRTERARVKGITVTTPRVISRDGTPRFVSFDLDDGSGRITVAATRHVARMLVAENKLPGKGATVEVTGNPGLDRNNQLRLYMDGTLIISTPATTSAPETSL
jgi:hypothetical protein